MESGSRSSIYGSWVIAVSMKGHLLSHSRFIFRVDVEDDETHHLNTSFQPIRNVSRNYESLECFRFMSFVC